VILELGDGRSFHLPDEMDDEAARQIKTFILVTEEEKRTAQAEVRAMRAEVTAMRSEVVEATKRGELNAAALKALQDSFAQGMAQLVASIDADREIVDETGERIRSRKVKG
jgi:hypothetical protein